MRKAWAVSVAMLIVGAVTIRAEHDSRALVVTSTNASENQLQVYDTSGRLVQTIATGGQGGVSGNAGGIATGERTVAVVNFGSGSVSPLERDDARFALTPAVAPASSPVSVAFGKGHLYVLGATTVESHQIRRGVVDPTPDGVVSLLHADGSAAQVGVAGDQLIIAEKSNAVEVAALTDGAVAGVVTAVPLPAGSDTPFGLVTRGANAYVTIAHSDEVSLVKHGQVVAVTATGTPGGAGQHSPCWIALLGPFLYTANSPSHSVSRLVATGANIILEEPVAAQTIGAPTDIAAADGLVAVIDSSNGAGRLSQFAVDEDGALRLVARTVVSSTSNGVVIVTK